MTCESCKWWRRIAELEAENQRLKDVLDEHNILYIYTDGNVGIGECQLPKELDIHDPTGAKQMKINPGQWEYDEAQETVMTDERLRELIETTKGHTPGPWKNRMYFGGAFEIQLENAVGDRVEHVAIVDGSARTTRNAYLIAAAPELLTALTEARAELAELKSTFEKRVKDEYDCVTRKNITINKQSGRIAELEDENRRLRDAYNRCGLWQSHPGLGCPLEQPTDITGDELDYMLACAPGTSCDEESNI